MPPNRGMNASNRVVHSQHHRCEGSVESTFYKRSKKWGCSLSTPAFNASPPFTEKEAIREWRDTNVAYFGGTVAIAVLVMTFVVKATA